MEIENTYTPEPIKKRIPETVIKKDSSVGINKMVEEKNNNVYNLEKPKEKKVEVYYGKKKMKRNKNVYNPEEPIKKIKEFKKIEVIEVNENTNVNDMSEDYSIDIEPDNDGTLTRSNNQNISVMNQNLNDQNLNNQNIPVINQNLNNQNLNGEIRDINDFNTQDFNTQDLDAILSDILDGSQH